MENTDSTGIDIDKEKKWMIARLELLHKSILDEYRIVDQLIDNVSKKEIDRVKGRRNNILTSLGVALTIILGLATVTTIGNALFFGILASILLIGLVAFVVFNFIMVKEENVFYLLSSSMKEFQGHVSYNFGYFITKTAIYSSIDYSFLYNFFIFSMLLNASITKATVRVIEECQKEKFLNPDIKTELKFDDDAPKSILENVPNLINQFNRSQDVPVKILEFVDKELSEYFKENIPRKQ